MYEEFEVVPVYRGYLAGTDGFIYKVREGKEPRMLKGETKKQGIKVALRITGCYHLCWAHRAVAMAFIPNPDNYRFVLHLNGDKFDNRPENLVWSNSSTLPLYAKDYAPTAASST